METTLINCTNMNGKLQKIQSIDVVKKDSTYQKNETNTRINTLIRINSEEITSSDDTTGKEMRTVIGLSPNPNDIKKNLKELKLYI